MLTNSLSKNATLSFKMGPSSEFSTFAREACGAHTC
jgi:hypothetical protein